MSSFLWPTEINKEVEIVLKHLGKTGKISIIRQEGKSLTENPGIYKYGQKIILIIPTLHFLGSILLQKKAELWTEPKWETKKAKARDSDFFWYLLWGEINETFPSVSRGWCKSWLNRAGKNRKNFDTTEWSEEGWRRGGYEAMQQSHCYVNTIITIQW